MQDDRRCCVRQNRVVPTPVAGAKLPVAKLIRPDRLSHQAGSDGGKTNSSPGRARHKPSTHCAGNAGVLRLYLYARVRSHCNICTPDRGCSKHPAFPAPSQEGWTNVHASLGRSTPRERTVILSRHRPRRRTIQYVRPAWALTWRWKSSRELVTASEGNRRVSDREAGVKEAGNEAAGRRTGTG